jgi:hypothetical protein
LNLNIVVVVYVIVVVYVVVVYAVYVVVVVIVVIDNASLLYVLVSNRNLLRCCSLYNFRFFFLSFNSIFLTSPDPNLFVLSNRFFLNNL